MKLKLISVGRLPWYAKGASAFSFFYPRLGLLYISALTPPDWDVEICDGVGLTDIDFTDSVDLVGFSVLTPFAHETYKAASIFQQKGVKVIMGGIHPTLMPKEAKEYADTVVIGEGESVWNKLLEDFKNNRLKDFYKSEELVSLASLPIPRYSILNKENYAAIKAVQIIRGCPYGQSCKFCIVPAIFGEKYRFMPVEKAIEEIKILEEMQSDKELIISGCCALNNWDYIKSFATALKPLYIKWRGSGQLPMLNNDKLLKLLKDSGCECIYTESGAVSNKIDPIKYEKYCDAIKKIHDNGISISYNFTIGFDGEDKTIFEEIKNFIDKNNLRRDMCVFQLFVPWPNTSAYNELDNSGRLFDKDWRNYNNTRVVYIPQLMSIQELTENYFRNLKL